MPSRFQLQVSSFLLHVALHSLTLPVCLEVSHPIAQLGVGHLMLLECSSGRGFALLVQWADGSVGVEVGLGMGMGVGLPLERSTNA